MKHDLQTYLILCGIFLLSISGSYLVPAEELLKSAIAAPGVVALLAALYQLIRDQAAYEKQLEIQQKQFQFTIGAASHMANIAFNKHVDFCEKYMSEIHNVMGTLFREGETTTALTHAGILYKLRESYAVWLTESVNSELETFEGAIRELGAHAHFIKNSFGNERHSEQRTLHMDNAFDLIHEIMGWDKSKEINENYAVSSAQKKVKNILGIEELTGLRKHLVHEASKALNQIT